MKKFTLLVLALAFAAAPAFAGDFSNSGTYWLKGYSVTDDASSTSDQFFMNDFELITTFTSGAVTVTADWELVDANATYGGTALQRDTRTRTVPTNDLLDNYWITYKYSDALTLKTGDYGLDWGSKIAVYNQGGYNIGLTYGLDMVDLGFTMAQVTEGTNADGDADADVEQYLLSAAFKKAGPFTKLNFYLLYHNDEPAEISENLIAGEFAVPAGPVALSGEFGVFGGDNAEGNYLFLTAGLKELVGFNLDASLLYTSDTMYTGFGELFMPLTIALNNDLGPYNFTNDNLTLLIIKGSYAINDKLTVGGAIMPLAMFTDKDTFGAPEDSIGMEFDVNATYKLADNVSYDASIGYLALEEDNFGPDATVMALYNKITFKF